MAGSYEYHPGGRLLAGVLAFLGLHIVLLTVGFGSSAMQLSLLQRAAQGEEITQEEADSNDQREMAIGSVVLAEFLFLAILFLSALSRANANAHALGAEGLTYTPGWTVAWFFIPIANLFKPYLTVRETWRASDPAHLDWRQNHLPKLLPIWWTLWLVSSVLDRVTTAYSRSAESVSELTGLTIMTMASGFVAIVLSVVAATLLYRLYALQERRRQLVDQSRFSCVNCGEPLDAEVKVCAVCGMPAGAPAGLAT
ncbi:MAG: DUF4328 domain-containing protein [Planctomycetota bacterium]|nr:DUF4328 domain-containing protein [Planctomycetota bacterium]